MDPELQKSLKRLRDIGYSDDQLRDFAAQWTKEHAGIAPPLVRPDATDTSSPADATEINPGNLLASLMQGGSFGYAGREGIIDPAKASAFSNAHPVADAAAKTAGMAVLPASVTALFPELASALGVSGMAGAAGALEGSSHGTDAASRVKNAAVGGVTSAAAALGANAALKGAGKYLLTPLYKGLFPNAAADAAVGTAAKSALTPAEAARIQARVNSVNAIAPGASSVMTAAVPETGIEDSRFKDMLKGLGADPDAAKAAEAQLVQQRQIQSAARKQLGQQMDQLQGRIPGSLQLRSALVKVRDVLGSGTPLSGQLPPSSAAAGAGLDVQDARTALSTLRRAIASAQDAERPDGVRIHALIGAKNELQKVIYDYAASPNANGSVVNLAQLDKQYAQLWDESRSTDRLLPFVQRSAGSYNSTKAYGADAGSLGASLPSSPAGFVKSAATSLLSPSPRPAVARATVRSLMDPDFSTQDLLEMAPGTPRIRPAIRAGIATALPPALKGLLFPEDDEQHQP